MGTQEPLVMDLGDPGAGPGTAGGKGSSLARLTRAGFHVPPGFYVTTSAYLDFIGRDGLREQLLSALSEGSPAARIGDLFADRSLPAGTAEAITRAYAALGAEVPVAVRSSATVEDQPGMSAAGQHDTYLNVRGEAAVLDTVKRCWASLWSERAIAYRASHGIDPAQVSIAVVVQRLVPAAAAGVLFTVDPLAGPGPSDVVVISANWGLGESVVAGDVTPDVAVVDRASKALVSYQTGRKETMTVLGGLGTRTEDTSPGLRAKNVLTPDQAAELAQVGLEIEKLYGQPVDVEWALAAGEFDILQARPITTPPSGSTPAPASVIDDQEQWNDSLTGDYLWSNSNLGEAFPDVMTPATWSSVELLMSRMVFPPSTPGYNGYGRIGGRFYVNVSMSMALEALVGISPRRFISLLSPIVGRLPPLQEIPRPRLPRVKVMAKRGPALLRQFRRMGTDRRRVPLFLAESPDRCGRLRAEIGRATDPIALARLWPAQVRPLLVESFDMLVAVTSRDMTLLTTPAKLRSLVGESDATLLLSGQQAGDTGLASLGPATGLARLARGELDRDTFVRDYGHRGAHEAELSAPRPGEDPAWPDNQLAALARAKHTDGAAGTGRDADALLAEQEAARAAAWERLAQTDPKKAAAARRLVSRWASVARDREAVRSELARALWVARDWVRRAGELTGLGDDLFFLELEESFRLLNGDQTPLERLPVRRGVYETYQALPPFPTLIRGRFDPLRWAADPNRSTDYYAEHAQPAVETALHGTITGFPGAAGVAEGTARVLRTLDDAAQLGEGEILVTPVTNIGWTPLFPRAAAVVTDVGAPLSHAAIVARELGIPAVVGCGNATARISSGDWLRVDGAHGTVEVVQSRTGPPGSCACRVG
jgi:pyruvate,water dikinase